MPIPKQLHVHCTIRSVRISRSAIYFLIVIVVVYFLELSLPTESTYKVEETTRGITVLEEFDPDQPPSSQNQPPNIDILDKVKPNRSVIFLDEYSF